MVKKNNNQLAFMHLFLIKAVNIVAYSCFEGEVYEGYVRHTTRMYSMTQRFRIHALKILELLETWIMTKSLHHYLRQKPGRETFPLPGLICTK